MLYLLQYILKFGKLTTNKGTSNLTKSTLFCLFGRYSTEEIQCGETTLKHRFFQQQNVMTFMFLSVYLIYGQRVKSQTNKNDCFIELKRSINSDTCPIKIWAAESDEEENRETGWSHVTERSCRSADQNNTNTLTLDWMEQIHTPLKDVKQLKWNEKKWNEMK